MKVLKTASLIILIIVYTCAGINHFRVSESYIRIIPHYIPFPIFINALSGILEILFGIMLIFKLTRPFGALGICLLLIAFLPVHIQMVIDAPFMLGTLAVTPLLAWMRLLLQPVLILWAWWHVNDKKL
jgi:uncharacterized membrane protein